MERNSFGKRSTATCSVLGSCIAIGLALPAHAAISQQPLSLTEGVSPNLLVTLDDSGSMIWAYAPDAIEDYKTRPAGRSNAFNAMYYNPDVTYEVPKQVSFSDGNIIVTDYPTPSFTKAFWNGFDLKTSWAEFDLSTEYKVQWDTGAYNAKSFVSTCPSGMPKNSCKDGVSHAYYFNYNVSSTCPPPPNTSGKDSCYTYQKVKDSERTNFAIWFSFYRNRSLATRTAANLAFYKLPENVRITWGALSECFIGSNQGGLCFNNKIDEFSGAHRENFFKWLANFEETGATPLHAAMHRAGKLLQKESTYVSADGSSSSCQASYHIMMTDGVWNSRTDKDSPGNSDSALPYPYKDAYSNTLADVAYYYWKTDLNTKLQNNIRKYIPFVGANDQATYNDPRNNPAEWQHMVNFIVGLGLSRSLTNATAPTWTGSTFGNVAELMAMSSNGKRWPEVGPNDQNNVYDLWHAAINSRGEFFSTDSPDALVEAFAKILSRIADRTTSAASPAINSGILEEAGDQLTSYSYQTSYSSRDSWSGDLKSATKTRTWNAATGQFSVASTDGWSARDRLDTRAGSWSARQIMIAGGNHASGLQRFSWSNAGDAGTVGTLAYYLRQNPDDGDILEPLNATLAQDRLGFLHGDRSREGTLFRERRSLLGDMIGSRPAVVRGARYLPSQAERLENDSNYLAFANTHRTRRPHIYVGANDGMLHVFDAESGDETFAFVPSAVFPRLHKLTGKSYQGAAHQFYVDGSPVIADAYLDGQWRTVLIGTLRAGGKGLFALDVTDPADIRLLWEFGAEQLPNDYTARLGYSFAQPTVARLHHGKWAVVVGNGYHGENHTTGKAALLIIDLASGELTKSLEVSGEEGIANGLSTPTLADINSDGVADYAYAGDLQGNLWRFNLSPANNPAEAPFSRANEGDGVVRSFKVSYGGAPLFRAERNSVRQPITAPPALIRHPTGLGYLVVVGTGKYFEEGDKWGQRNGDVALPQSIYGIWDIKTDSTSPNDSLQPDALTRSGLQAQTMNADREATLSGKPARLLTDTPVTWATPPAAGSTTWGTGKYGWYFDLPLEGEMMIERMQVFGQTLFFQSLVPNSDPCSPGVENWTYAINPQTGGRTRHHAFNEHRSSADPDKVISAVQQDGEGGLTLGQEPDGDYVLCTGLDCESVAPDPSSIGRQSWRIVEEEQ